MTRAWAVLAAILASASLAFAGDPAKTTLKVEGMTCGGCVAAVKVQLKKTEGVTAYEVSLEKGEAEVSYDLGKTTPEKIAASVSKTGFKTSVKKAADAPGGSAADPSAAGSTGEKCGGTSRQRDCCKAARHSTSSVLDPEACGLVSLAQDTARLGSAFNRVKDRPRFLAILSPTCSACVHGAEAIKAVVLPAGPEVGVFVVWTPMLDGDGAGPAASSSAIVNAPNVRQYWDPERRVGGALRTDVFPDALDRMKKSLPKGHFFTEYVDKRDGRQPEWDIYLLFAPGVEWTDRAPRPSRWVRQTALYGGEQPTSLMWRDDYASPPVEGRLTDELRKLMAGPGGTRTGAAR